MPLLLNNFRNWFLQHKLTGELVKGHFAPQDHTKNINPKWAAHVALSRTKEIHQFLGMGEDEITFEIVLRDDPGIFGFNEIAPQLGIAMTAKDIIEKLESWTRPDPLNGNRPPTLIFYVGKAWEKMECVIWNLSSIKYKEPDVFGRMLGLTAQITLRRHSDYTLDAKANFDTRYHRSLARDYYEMLAWREYKSPILGDVIRKDHPSKPNIVVGDVIRLPSVESVRTKVVAPDSLVLVNSFSKKMTVTKERRLEMFELRNRPYVSHVLVG